MVKAGGAKPNNAVRLQVMFSPEYVFKPRPSALKGRSQRTKGQQAVCRFGDLNVLSFCSSGGDPYRRVPLVVERDSGRTVVSGYAFIGEWIRNEWEKWIVTNLAFNQARKLVFPGNNPHRKMINKPIRMGSTINCGGRRNLEWEITRCQNKAGMVSILLRDGRGSSNLVISYPIGSIVVTQSATDVDLYCIDTERTMDANAFLLGWLEEHEPKGPEIQLELGLWKVTSS